jgi:hypothetical protein
VIGENKARRAWRDVFGEEGFQKGEDASSRSLELAGRRAIFLRRWRQYLKRTATPSPRTAEIVTATGLPSFHAARNYVEVWLLTHARAECTVRVVRPGQTGGA